MHPVLRMILVVGLALAVPIVPFVLFGEPLEAWFALALDGLRSPSVIFAAVVAALSTDVLLPVPASVVSTVAGSELGVVVGTLASWLGMTVGACLGFALARWLGQPLVSRLASRRDMSALRRMSERQGALILVLFRAAPVLAEASVLLLGAGRMSWSHFVPPVALANLGVALAYAAFGQVARSAGWLPAALALAAALPLVVAALLRKKLTAQVEAAGA